MRSFKPLFIVTVLAGTLAPSAPVLAQCLTHELVATKADSEKGPTGATMLCIREHALSARLEIQHLPPRQVFSAWWVYFPEPGKCLQPIACSYADLLEPYGGSGTMDTSGNTPQGVLGRLASGISRRTGEVSLKGKLRNFRVHPEAELWVVLIAHGPADRDDGLHRARQLLTPETPELGRPYLGNDLDGWLGEWRAVSVFELDANGTIREE